MQRETQTWIDITEQLSQSKKMNLLSSVSYDGYSLQDSMQAHEINDPKIDPKHDISHEDSIGYWKANGKVKEPSELTIRQIRDVYRRVLKLQALVLCGNPLPQTIYTFIYLFDKTICRDSNSLAMAALVESINTMGAYIYDLLKESCQIKEDDIGISSFSYSKDRISNEDVIAMLLKVEKEVQAQGKGKNAEERKLGEEVLGFLRLRRAIHALPKSMGKHYDQKSANKIQSDIAAVRKRLAEVDLEDDDKEEGKLEGVFSDTLAKTLRSHFGPREVKLLPLKESIQIIQGTFKQLQMFVPPPSRMSEWRNRLQILQLEPLNLWSKSYIKLSLLSKQGYLFGCIKQEDALANDIGDWVSIRDSVRSQEKYVQLVQQSSPVITQTLYRLLGNSMRWHWEISKIYDDYNYLIYMANELDIVISGKRDIYVCSWYYYYGIGLMVRQLLVGFRISMYEECELPYVVYYLESLLSISERNSQSFMKKMDKQYITAFHEGTLVHKRKKKFDANVRKMFSDVQFKKALHLYIRAFNRILAVLQTRGHFVDPFSEKIELRAKNRFRIFKHIAFIRRFEFSEFKASNQQLSEDAEGCLVEAFQLLKDAKALFQSVSNLQENDVYCGQRKDSHDLIKLCVQGSLVVMSLKMNQKKKYKVCAGCSTIYPELQLS